MSDNDRATIELIAAQRHLAVARLRERYKLRDAANGVEIPHEGGRVMLRKYASKPTESIWLGKGEIGAFVDDETLDAARAFGELVVVEGQTDRLALEEHGVPALGIPGATNGKTLSEHHFRNIRRLLVIREPGDPGNKFPFGIYERARELRFEGDVVVVDLQAVCGVKDPCELHVRNPQRFDEEWQRAVNAAERWPMNPQFPPLYAQPELDPVALHGLAGEIVRYLDPLVEAAPVGILLELLAAFGCAAGPESYAAVQDDKHPAKLFVCLVGPTSTGGKGSADAAIRPFIRAMDPAWFKRGRILGGFGSGESIIAHLSGDHTEAGEIAEKRVLQYEPEFTRLLALGVRDGATITSRQRQLWDTEDVRDILRGKSSTVEGAHVCIIAHVTPEELRTKLPQIDIHGGSANRYLFAYVCPNKRIPNPEELNPGIIEGFAKRLASAERFARDGRVMRRTPEADAVWERFYASHRSAGIVGEIVAREDAQRLRLSVAYALLDESPFIRPEHVLAGEAVIRYCVGSAAFIFDDHPEARQLRELLCALQNAWPRGLNGAERHAVFSNHLDGESMSALESQLVARGLASGKETPTGGRAASLLYANPRIKRTKLKDDELSSLYSHFCGKPMNVRSPIGAVQEGGSFAQALPCSFHIGQAGSPCRRCGTAWEQHKR